MMDRPVIFLGPSLPPDAARSLAAGEVEWREPARRGDIYRAVRDGATRIALIDGYFGAEPTVNHKEILWGLRQGCRFWGGASLGALRAAELHPFGMVGIGVVFARFLAGDLHRDDEVAVVHAPGELGFARLSEPLIHIRIAVENAIRAGEMPPPVGQSIVCAAAALPIEERSLDRAVECSGAVCAARPSLVETLRRHWTDQKACDAEAVIVAAMRDEPSPVPSAFDFHDTWFFERLRKFEDNPLLRTLDV